MQGLMALAITAALGLYAPAIWLWMIRKGRMERIFLSLPDLLDLLVVCVEAGLGLDAAMRRVAEELEDSSPDASFEFAMCNMQLQMGIPKKQVLHDLGIRSGVDDMKALAAILIQAEKFGSSIAQALRVQSDTMRVKRRQMAEEKAQQTSVKMIFPLVIFIFPGVFVVIVGPAAIMMINNLLSN
jgi:tight adherence protein C